MNCGAKYEIMQKAVRGEQEKHWQVPWIIMHLTIGKELLSQQITKKICGYCAVSKKDCIPDVDYTPYISFIFIDEEYRGNRLSQQLIGHAIDSMKKIGYNRVYIVSDHKDLYEKYGFRVIDRKIAPWGFEEKNICTRVLIQTNFNLWGSL